jgi:DNA polymerase-3 subunit delta
VVALKGRAVKTCLAEKERVYSALLIYGPDGGLVRERADILARKVVSDLKDPFNAIDLTDADLKAEPGRLIDEAAALSFTGGERVVRLRTNGEAAAGAAERFLDALDAGRLKSNALVLIEAGELSPRSGLRKAFEKARNAAAMPCYGDGPEDVRAIAQSAARAEDLTFEADALDLLAFVLGDDRGVSRAEIDKMILYKGPRALRPGPGTISLDDARACLADGLGDAMDETAAAAADGAPARLAAALNKAAAAGASPIGQLRALQRSLGRLKAAREIIDGGETAFSAMKKLRPPVFFAEQRSFEARLRRWSAPKLDAALRMLVEAELDAKTAGAPQRILVERAALRLALMAER